ncbi:MAG: M48 family metalloprotease [Deltaproteobacteria bacterium]|nr:M48 family metalloprotease [Deltaproteobacteria bacterium]
MRTLAAALLLIAFPCGAGAAFNLESLGRQLLGPPASSTPQPAPEQKPESPGLVLDVSEEDEIRAGQEVATNLLGAAPLVEDEGLQRYVSTLGRWIALQTERPKLPWRFGVIDSMDVNAFACPGGYVLVTKGLYAKLTDESELAGVLAHEISHVIRRHYVDLMRKQSALALGASFLETTLRKEKTQVVKNLVGSGAEIFARSLDKSAEFEADRTAVVLAARAGYDPYGLPAVLQKLEALAATDSTVALLFKTHPDPATRLARLSEAMGERLDAYGAGGGGALYRLQ